MDDPTTSRFTFEDKYDVVKELGSGNFGVTKLVRDKSGGQLLAAKFMERGKSIDTNVEREILIHRTMTHPNIVKVSGETSYQQNTKQRAARPHQRLPSSPGSHRCPPKTFFLHP